MPAIVVVSHKNNSIYSSRDEATPGYWLWLFPLEIWHCWLSYRKYIQPLTKPVPEVWGENQEESAIHVHVENVCQTEMVNGGVRQVVDGSDCCVWDWWIDKCPRHSGSYVWSTSRSLWWLAFCVQKVLTTKCHFCHCGQLQYLSFGAVKWWLCAFSSGLTARLNCFCGRQPLEGVVWQARHPSWHRH